MSEPMNLIPISRRKTSFLERLAKASRPEMLLLYSFATIILIGSFLLSLPVSNAIRPAPYIDNLFTAVSAVCVTGLSTVTAASQYSTFGKIVMIFLMQIGGLGPMTIIAVILQQNQQRMDTVEKKLFAAGAGKSDLHDVPRYLRRIMLYTLLFESAGFVLLGLRMTGLYGLKTGLFNALFLSVSAFTNAGFDCIGADSLVRFASDPIINLTVMALIITGGLGFMVWFELSEVTRSRLGQGDLFRTRYKYLSVHARVVLRTTAILLTAGTVLFLALEFRNPMLAGMSGAEKILVSMFQSVTLRTAGFSTVVIGRCTRPTLLIMCIFMLIGGSPGGTAGGMKTTTAAVLYKTTVNALDQKHKDAVIGHRTISASLLKHAFMVLSLYISIIFVMLLILTISEPETPLLNLMFEVFSAIATVGISTGITAMLSVPGRIVIMILMFIGRLGPLSLYAAFHKPPKIKNHVTYPDAEIIIG